MNIFNKKLSNTW